MLKIVPDELRARLLSKDKFLVSTVDVSTINAIEEWILRNRVGENQKTKFTLVINSSGGSPGLVVYFASFLRTLSEEVKIKGVAFGECGSAALALLQCCDERVGVKHCGFFIHNINHTLKLSCQTYSLQTVGERLEASKRLEDELTALQSKRCGMSKQKWKKLAKNGEENHGLIILSDEAKKLGLVDKIIDKYPIF